MAKCVRVGVLALQGDVSEHVRALRESLCELGTTSDVVEVLTQKDLPVDALVIPGGESTTLGKLLKKTGLDKEIKELAKTIPVMGTCAGLVLLAKEGGRDVEKTGQRLLGLMDVRVNRNAFGRQRESFEAELIIPVLGEEPFHTVFIRAPAIEKVLNKKKVEVLARYEDKIVMARQRNLLAVAFHPELTNDHRIHRYFLGLL